jgi:hypothetical protein
MLLFELHWGSRSRRETASETADTILIRANRDHQAQTLLRATQDGGSDTLLRAAGGSRSTNDENLLRPTES